MKPRSTASGRRRGAGRALAAAYCLATTLVLGGCSSAIDYIPTKLGGLPEGVPERPPTPKPYPAVHDMPPPRSAALTEAERKRLKADLERAREGGVVTVRDDATGSTPGTARTP